MYRTLFVTAYFGLFRVRELTSGMHPVWGKDVHIADNKQKAMFILHTSKTHWRNNQPQIIKISSEPLPNFHRSNHAWNNHICPYSLLRQYLLYREPAFITKEEPFFIFRDRSVVTPEHFRKILQITLSNLGLNPTLYCSHLMRIGRATDMYEKLHISIESIRKIGRWRSNVVYQYLKN